MPKAGCLCLGRAAPEVGVLDYRHSNLDFIPSDVFTHERTLEELNVDANQIRDLPRELFYCHGLRKLSVADNELTSIPPAIATLTNLEELVITKNGIVDLPENIKGCKYLKTVEASVNPLGKIPEGFTQLLQLSELYLNDTFLDFLPGSFGRLSKLRILELRENHLKTLPRSMARLTMLERLDIGNNEFQELPEVVGSMTSLLELWCDTNHIKLIPKEVGSLKQLMFLDASKNRVESIEPEIEGCLALADLHLSTNLLTQLPESVGRLSNLTSLKVDDNRLTCLPFSIGGLVSLSELNVGANDLEEIPPSIGLLRHLRTLYADENFLLEIPSEMGSCSGLTVLSLRSNNLTNIPDEIGRIPRLRVLNLSDNKIRCLPFSLTKLKQLQALWLAENQTKPLIKLQSDIDIDTGQRVLTCYLLPQQATEDKEDMYSDTDSFHPSLWEEERQKRQQIHFEFADLPDEEEGRLERTPTPYPKEMKQRVQHVRNLAMKQLGNTPNGDVHHVMKASGVTALQNEQAVVGRRDSPHKPGSSRASQSCEDVVLGSNKPLSPSLCERHHLLKADKEKLQKDKARVNKKGADTNNPDMDDGGFSQSSGGRRSVNNTPNASLSRPDSNSQPGSLSNIPHNGGIEEMSYNEFLQGLSAKGVVVPKDAWSSYHKSSQRSHSTRKRSSHHVRGRGYDSDTGYRSDYTNYRSGYSSDQPMNNSRSKDMFFPLAQPPAPGGLPRRRRDGGYSSDAETYVRRRSDGTSQSLPVHPDLLSRSGHSGSHNSIQSTRSSMPPSAEPTSYTNPSVTKRTTIRNDELYGFQPQVSHLKPQPSSTRHVYLTDSLQHRDTDKQSVVSDRSVRETIKEETEVSGVSSGDDQWKSELYAASLKLQKSPGPSNAANLVSPNKLKDCQEGEALTEQHDGSSLSQPARRALDFPDVTESPHSQRLSRSHGNRASSLPPAHNNEASSLTPSRPHNLPVQKSLDSSLTDAPRSMQHGYSDPRLHSSHHPHSYPSSTHHTPMSTPSGKRQPIIPLSHHRPNTNITDTDKCNNSGSMLHVMTDFSVGGVSGLPTPEVTTAGPGLPWRPSQYEKDVAVYKQVDPPSQVSSSTDSGYSHGPLLETSARFPSVSPAGLSPGGAGDANPADNSYRGLLQARLQPSDVPVRLHSEHRTPSMFSVTLNKNPGLGFSIAGGIGSPGNPFRPDDSGIFITRVQEDGPGANILMPGDKILQVNGVDFTKLDHDQAVVALRKSNHNVDISIERC